MHVHLLVRLQMHVNVFSAASRFLRSYHLLLHHRRFIFYLLWSDFQMKFSVHLHPLALQKVPVDFRAAFCFL